MVRGGAAAGRAHQARPRPPPVSRQVRSATGRDLPQAAVRSGPVRLRSVRRVGDDARRGERLSAPTQSAPTSRRSTASSAVSRQRATTSAQLELSLRAAVEEARRAGPAPIDGASDVARRWFAPPALGELLRYREVCSEYLDDPAWDVAKIVLSRAARSARLTTHFDLDFPRAPTTQSYFCHKHKRTCRPVEEAQKFLARYTSDTIRRIRAFARGSDEPERRCPP